MSERQPRHYMIERREKIGLTRRKMARKLGISDVLLGMLEEDEEAVTHPKLVERIAKTYRLSEEQRIGMLPENYRPGPGYDPNKYVMDITDYRSNNSIYGN